MKIILPGGSGQIGRMLARALTADGHGVVVLSRDPRADSWGRVVAWDGRSVGPWARELEGADAVINLAGRSVNCRYGAANRKSMLDSRVESTRAVGEAIARCDAPPRVWLQASTATIYAHRLDAPNDEVTGIVGGREPDAPPSWRFSIEVALAWERALAQAVTPRTRKVALRSAMTMSPDAGGIFDVLMGLVRKGLGGRAASGAQYVSWIHYEDWIRAIYLLIERDDLSGPVNLAAPGALPNRDFMRALRDAAGVRLGLPAAAWMLELGALVLRTETELLLKSRRVYPRRLIDSGFAFRHPDWPAAAEDLCSRWRAAQRSGSSSAKRGRVDRWSLPVQALVVREQASGR